MLSVFEELLPSKTSTDDIKNILQPNNDIWLIKLIVDVTFILYAVCLFSKILLTSAVVS